jgi:hypothetical protein
VAVAKASGGAAADNGLYARDLKLARRSGGCERQPDQALCEPIPADAVRVDYFGLDEREGAELMSLFFRAASFDPCPCFDQDVTSRLGEIGQPFLLDSTIDDAV